MSSFLGSKFLGPSDIKPGMTIKRSSRDAGAVVKLVRALPNDQWGNRQYSIEFEDGVSPLKLSEPPHKDVTLLEVIGGHGGR